MSRKLLFFLVFPGLIVIFAGALCWWKFGRERFLVPILPRERIERPLEKYSFANLGEREYEGSEIKLEKIIKEEKEYTSWLFSFQSDGKRVTGMANIPKFPDFPDSPDFPDTFPVILMLRGYADDEIYFTGLGTRKAAGVFAENGFITLAPDFLGFGGSDSPSEDILEARFERPVTVLNLLASIERLKEVQYQCHSEAEDRRISMGSFAYAQDDDECTNPLVQKTNPNRIFLWAHSNGGQIALSVLEISGKSIPTTLWAPVTKGFPASVLDYIGDPPAGGGDQVRKVVERIFEFEKYYDPKEFSIDTYFDRIQAPLQVQQGGGDLLVKKEWTDDFVAKIRGLGKGITYYSYPNADHNLEPAWNTAVSRDLDFFREFLR